MHLIPYYLNNEVRGGHSTFFQVGVCGPDFRSVGLANWHLPLKRGACERKISKFGGLWAENFQIWGLVSWKFPNLGACELKFGWKLRLLRLKFPNFLKRGSCELTLLLEMGPLRAAGEAWKGGLQGRTSPYPLSRSVPPPGMRFSSPSSPLPSPFFNNDCFIQTFGIPNGCFVQIFGSSRESAWLINTIDAEHHANTTTHPSPGNT